MAPDPSFRMIIEDVFNIRGRGTVVTGRVERGTLAVGDKVQIQGQRAVKTTAVDGIEAFRKSLRQAKAGDNIGVLLRDVSRDDIHQGDVLAGGDFS